MSKQGKILFGILLKYERCEEVVDGDNDLWLQVGQEVHPDSFQHQGNCMEKRFCSLKME